MISFLVNPLKKTQKNMRYPVAYSESCVREEKLFADN